MKVASLIYHDVITPGRDQDSGFAGADAAHYKLTLEAFDAHLHALAAALGSDVAPGLPHDDAPRAILTFDDGGCSAISHVAPQLAQRKWRAAFFVTAGMIGKPGFLQATELRSLASAGHAIGSHSMSHPVPFSALSPKQMHEEWSHSRKVLEDILGHDVTLASVPGGFYSRLVRETAGAAGIRDLFTSEPQTTVQQFGSLRVFGRFSVVGNTPARSAANLLGGAGLDRSRQFVYWNAKKLLKRAGGPLWLQGRKLIFNLTAGQKRSR
jgi:peptidoglycan/xylan/chitin deacetylase (PgdA/CDA1 family)